MSAVICSECHIEPTTREDGRCYGCMLAIRDDTGKRNIAESRYDLEPLGGWKFDPVRRVEVWVPHPPAPPEPEPEWPELWDDSEPSAEQRMKALISDVKDIKARRSEAAA
ncbi:MAG TPA: hypothetical protein VIQ11_08305 [Mycobacterium sp.]